MADSCTYCDPDVDNSIEEIVRTLSCHLRDMAQLFLWQQEGYDLDVEELDHIQRDCDEIVIHIGQHSSVKVGT